MTTKQQAFLHEWPTEVPLLESHDIHKGGAAHLSENEVRYCCSSWIQVAFGSCDKEVRDLVRKEIWKLVGRGWDLKFHKWPTIPSWNDNPIVTHAMIAAVWNEAMNKLGYFD